MYREDGPAATRAASPATATAFVVWCDDAGAAEWGRCRRMKAHATLAGLAAAILAASAVAREGEWRWRLSRDGDRLTLVYADTHEGTDNFGSPRFTCRRGSGTIRVEHVMRQAERRAFAAAIAKRLELALALVPASRSPLSAEVSYSPVDGWIYGYEIGAEEQAFDRFKATGVYRYKLGKTPLQSELKAGLQAVGQFQDACRRKG
jgi:hypothetical protein